MERNERCGAENILQSIGAPSFPPTTHILARLGLSETATLADASTEELINALQSQRWERRASAATTMGKKASDIFIHPLLKALRDECEEVRASAARALGRIRTNVPVAALAEALQDHSPLVREAAATALGKMKAVPVVDILLKALRDECEEVRASAARALGRIRTNVPVAALAEALQDHSSLVREAAATALGELGLPSARLPLLAHVQEEEVLAREAIAQALMRLESSVAYEFIQVLLKEKRSSIQKIARFAVTRLVDLGLNVHEEIGSIAPLVVARQSVNKGVEKMVTCYLVGRAIDVLNERTQIMPLIDLLKEDHQEQAALEGVWKTVSSLAEGLLKERKIIRLLVAAANDSHVNVRDEIKQAVDWFIELALTLLDERLSTRHLREILSDPGNSAYGFTVRYLIGQAIEALEQREAIEPLLAELSRPEAERRAEVGKILKKRARKALMGRIPTGPLVISLTKAQQQLAPVKLQFGVDQEETTKDDQQVFPWEGPTLNTQKLPSSPCPVQCDPHAVAIGSRYSK